MWGQTLQSVWDLSRPMKLSKVINHQREVADYSTCGNLVVLALLFLPEFLMCYLCRSQASHRINWYYTGMIVVPILFMLATGSMGAYVSLFRNMYLRCSWKTSMMAVGTLIFGFAIQSLCFFLVFHHAEWNVWHFGATPWRDMGNVVFLLVNPAMETFFWRVFMHRELALRWFPSKSQFDEKLLSLTTGTPVLPRLSVVGTLVNAAAFSLYHYVPIMLFDLPIYSHAGMTYDMGLTFMVWLLVFGILALHVRENLGIVAAWTLHLGVDTSDVLMYTYIMIKLSGHPSAQLFKSWE